MPRNILVWGFFVTGNTDRTYMARALELAEKGRGKTSPNPLVGAVIVKNNKIISEGYHKAVGKDHAEIMALKNVHESVAGSTLYVNLEPCCHTGRTGPCTEAIIKNEIKKVVIGIKDPNKLVHGKGIRQLKKAGIEVVTNILKDESFYINDSYVFSHQNKRPFVTLKLAQTLDGKIATNSHESKYLSSKKSLTYVHKLRADVDAVVIGSQTAMYDNPQLTVRLSKGQNPYRIILSRSLNFSDSLNLIKNNADYKTIIASTEKSLKSFSLKKNNAITWTLKPQKGKIDLHDFLVKAQQFNISSILCEGGAKLASSFLAEKLVDKIVLVTVPKIMGKGIDSFASFKTDKLSDMVEFQKHYTFKSGDDSIFVGYPKWGKA